MTFAEMGRQHFGGDLKGKWILTAGLGGMGGAQPLAAVMAGAHCIAIECQESRIEKRLETRYLDKRATSIDEALDIIAKAEEPTSVGRSAMQPKSAVNAEAEPSPYSLTDRLGARPCKRLLPAGWTSPSGKMRGGIPPAVAESARASSPSTSRRFSPSRTVGPTFDYGTTFARIEEMASPSVDFPASFRDFRRSFAAIGPFRWVALSCDIPEDIYRPTIALRSDPVTIRICTAALHGAGGCGSVPASAHLLVGLGPAHKLGLAFNEMIRNGEFSARSSSPRPSDSARLFANR